MRYEFQIDIAVPNRDAVAVKRKAGDLVDEADLAAGSIASCLRLGQMIEAPPEQPPTPANDDPSADKADKPKSADKADKPKK